MRDVSLPRLILKRLGDDWRLLLGVFAGVVFTMTIAMAGPVYLGSLEQLAFRTSIGSLWGRFLDVDLFASNVPLTAGSISSADEGVRAAAERHLSPAYAGHTTYMRSSPYLVGAPGRELPDEPTNDVLLRGYLQSLSGLGERARVMAGRMAGGVVAEWPRGPLVEAVISRQTAERFDIGAGDALTLATVVEVEGRVSVLVTGVIEPDDPDGDYWLEAGIYLDPAPLFETPPFGVRVDPDDPPVGLFVDAGAMVDAIERANPGTLTDPVWFVKLEKDEVSSWSIEEASRRIDAFTEQVRLAMPDVTVRAGAITTTISTVERRGFFTAAPILLLLAVMGATVLFYMGMAVSYLVKSRERDTALIRSRGVGGWALFRLYLVEGLAVTMVGAAVSAALAFGAVAISGKLPYFSGITGGGFMPVRLESGPLLFGAAAALVCLVTLTAPGALSARAGLVFQKLSVSRPPAVSWFHRYYVDAAALALGGLVFWELNSRGQIISGGLFGDVGVNEPLLIAPALFLAVVGLLFVRLFPMALRYFSGESQGLVHLLAGSSALAAAAGIALRERGALATIDGALPLLVLAAFAAVYTYTARVGGRAAFAAGLAAQAAILAAFFAVDPPDARGWTFVADAGLMAVVPASALFPLFRASVRRAPVWVSATLWRMSRSPLQYTWLVLLLVLVTGLGILATTVGGTLEKSRAERILYEVGTDIHIIGSPLFVRGGMRRLASEYEASPAIEAAAVSLRTTGSAGPRVIEILGLDTTRFPHMAWYREDFSDRPLADVLARLEPGRPPGLAVPEAATEVGVWIKPLAEVSSLSLWVVLADAEGKVQTLTLGPLGHTSWHALRGEVPDELVHPVRLVSVQIYEPGAGPGQSGYASPTGTSGGVLIDDVHAVIGGRQEVLDDFEGPLDWAPIITSQIPTDSVQSVAGDAHGGERAAYFSFGAYRNLSVRGILHGAGRGAIPVVASESLASAQGLETGDLFIATAAGRLLLAEVRDTARHFPTMGGRDRGFVIADVDTLHEYLNMLSPVRKADLNEVFVTAAPGEGEAASAAILGGPSASFLEVEDGLARFEALLLDPFAGAGWQAITLLAIAVAVFSLGFGYAAYLLLFAKESRSEMAFLRSVGLSKAQLLGLLGFERLLIAAVGIGLGTWAGFQVSELMVSPLAVTESGASVVPPFVLVTDWWIMGPAYALFAALFVGSTAMLARGAGRLDLQSAARAGEA